MFVRWGPVVTRWRWLVLAAAVALLAVGGTWGVGVFDALSGGGFDDPDSESAIADERIAAEVGNQDTHLVVLYSSETATVDDPGFAGPVTGVVSALRASPDVDNVVSWYDAGLPDEARSALVSDDRHATYAAVRLAGGDDEDAQLDAYERVAPLLEAPGLTTAVGGLVPLLDESLVQTERDVIRAELLSFPVLLVLLVLIFRGVVAAMLPLLVGGLAILGAFVATRLITLATDVSVFAINIVTVIGLGMAIDYALLVVNRFREELDPAADSPAGAVARTLATAGRSVLVSGVTTMLALASLLIFPLPFLRSMALGGIAAIGIAMVSALTVLPAMLAVLRHRINAGRVRLPRWRARRSPGEGALARVTRSVMRRPVPYLVGVVVLLLALAAPAAGVSFGGFDQRNLPEGAPARVAAERLATSFPEASTTAPITVLVSGAGPGQVRAYADRLAGLPDVTGATVTAQRADSWVVSASYPGEPAGEAASDAVRAIRDLPPPEGAEALVTGRTAADLDLVAGVQAGLPWMLLLMAAAIMVVLFLAFGSVLLPVKAVLANLLSIAAALGVVVWGFQDGHLAGLLGFTATGVLDPAVVLLMLALLFGLSTDYEVFLLSRVRERWDRTGDNRESVAYGVQRTGRIITAAALLLIVVIGGFAAGEMAYVKLLGVGMIVAIAVDATLIRVLLVPATMRLLGRWTWWAPGPLARVYRRFGIAHPSSAGPAPSSPERPSPERPSPERQETVRPTSYPPLSP